MERQSPTRSWRWPAVLLAISFLVGLPAISAPYFSDDYQFVLESPSRNAAQYFLWNNPANDFYRPIQAAFLGLVQSVRGLDTTAIHAVQIVVHAALAMLVFNAVLGLGFKRRDAIVASLFVAGSQAAVMAVSSNDTVSQLLGVLAGYTAVWWFYSGARAHPLRPGLGDRRYVAALIALAVSLFAKETSAAFVPICAAVLLAGTGGQGRLRRVRVWAVRVVPIVIVLFLYVAARSAAGTAAPGLGEGRYGLDFGANMVKNLGMLWVAATIPFSSVSMFTAVATGNRAALGAFGVVYAVFAVLVATGLWQYRRDARMWCLLGVGMLGAASIVPVNHVSELYAYQVLPAAAVIVALGLGALAERRRYAWRTAWMVVVSAIVVSNVLAARAKAAMMDANGRRAETLLQSVVPYARALAPGGELLLVNPDGAGPEYSMFRMAGFHPLRDGEFYVARLAHRDDIAVRFVDDGSRPEPAPGRTILVMEKGRVEELPGVGYN